MTTLLPLLCGKGFSLKTNAYCASYLEGSSLVCTKLSTALQEHDYDVAVLC